MEPAGTQNNMYLVCHFRITPEKSNSSSDAWVLTKVGDGPSFASKLINPLGATDKPENKSPSSLPLLPATRISAIASAMTTAPPAPPVPFQPRFRAAEAMLSATALQNFPLGGGTFLFRIDLTLRTASELFMAQARSVEITAEAEHAKTAGQDDMPVGPAVADRNLAKYSMNLAYRYTAVVSVQYLAKRNQAHHSTPTLGGLLVDHQTV